MKATNCPVLAQQRADSPRGRLVDESLLDSQTDGAREAKHPIQYAPVLDRIFRAMEVEDRFQA